MLNMRFSTQHTDIIYYIPQNQIFFCNKTKFKLKYKKCMITNTNLKTFWWFNILPDVIGFRQRFKCSPHNIVIKRRVLKPPWLFLFDEVYLLDIYFPLWREFLVDWCSYVDSFGWNCLKMAAKVLELLFLFRFNVLFHFDRVG